MRSKIRKTILQKHLARQLTYLLSERISQEFGDIWKPVDASVFNWGLLLNEEPDGVLQSRRRVLLFHISEILDLDECELEQLQCSYSDADRSYYFKQVYCAIALEAIELGYHRQFNLAVKNNV